LVGAGFDVVVGTVLVGGVVLSAPPLLLPPQPATTHAAAVALQINFVPIPCPPVGVVRAW